MEIHHYDRHATIMTFLATALSWFVHLVFVPFIQHLSPISDVVKSWTQELSLVLAIIVSLITIYKFLFSKKNR